MNTFIQKNKKLLKFYYIVLRLSGWGLLIFSLISPVVMFILTKNSDAFVKEEIVKIALLHYFSLMFLGLFGIGLAQLLKYLFDSNYKPGFILSHGNKIIYAYVIFTFIISSKHIIGFVRYLRLSDMEGQLIFLSNFITYAVYFIAKAFILIGLAQFLKRLLPIIEEQKTLV
jgi:hypothetical protein